MILYGCIPRFFSTIEMLMEFVCLFAAITFYSPFLYEGKEQRLVAASCVFRRMRCFLPRHHFGSPYYYSCASRHSCMSQAHAYFGQNGNAAIKGVYMAVYLD